MILILKIVYASILPVYISFHLFVNAILDTFVLGLYSLLDDFVSVITKARTIIHNLHTYWFGLGQLSRPVLSASEYLICCIQALKPQKVLQ